MHTMQTSLSSPDRITIIIDENRDFIEMLHNPLLVLLLFSTDSFTAIAATAFLFTPHTALLGVLLHCSELFFFFFFYALYSIFTSPIYVSWILLSMVALFRWLNLLLSIDYFFNLFVCCCCLLMLYSFVVRWWSQTQRSVKTPLRSAVAPDTSTNNQSIVHNATKQINEKKKEKHWKEGERKRVEMLIRHQIICGVDLSSLMK